MEQLLRTVISNPNLAHKTDWLHRTPFELHKRIKFFNEHRYCEYEPTWLDGQFMGRLNTWTEYYFEHTHETDLSVKYEDIIHLLSLVTHIAYINQSETYALYRSAYEEHIKPWIYDLLDLNLFDPHADEKFQNALKRVWFCPITDGMRISAFIHANQLYGIPPHRPEMRFLARLLEKKIDILRNFMKWHSIRQIVLVEDFVGTGTQAYTSLKFLMDCGVKVLFVPLIIMPKGYEKLSKLVAESSGNLALSPVIKVSESHSIHIRKTTEEPSLHTNIRRISKNLFYRTQSELSTFKKGLKILGFQNCGGRIVLHTNCPNNSLSILHFHKNNSPLFPRVTRT